MRSKTVISSVVGYGPALASFVAVLLLRGPTAEGWGPTVVVGLMLGLGVLGLSALVLAWLPWTLERMGQPRIAAWLRRHWDEDAR